MSRLGRPAVRCSERSGYDCSIPVYLGARDCGNPDHFAGANGGLPISRPSSNRPKLIVDEDFDLIQMTPDLDPVTFDDGSLHITGEVLQVAKLGPSRLKKLAQSALTSGYYWRGPVGEHLLEVGIHRMTLSPDGFAMTRYEPFRREIVPDPEIGPPLDQLGDDWSPGVVQVGPSAVEQFMTRHRVDADVAIGELFDLLDDAAERGSRDTERGGRHVLRVNACTVKLAADGRTLVRYSTLHVERTPSQVRAGVPSRFGANRKTGSRRRREFLGLSPDERAALLSSMEVGDTRSAPVANVVNFGAFVDLGGIDGLIHISNFGTDLEHPSELLKVGQVVNVRIVEIDRERERVSLALVDPHQ